MRTYGAPARFGCLVVKFLEYSLGGMACGLIGQAIANWAMEARRKADPQAHYAVQPPPLLKTALVWGLFMGASSNLRYQAVFGLERLVDMTIARSVPQVSSYMMAGCALEKCVCDQSHSTNSFCNATHRHSRYSVLCCRMPRMPSWCTLYCSSAHRLVCS